MSESTAAPQHEYLESTMSLEEVEAAIVETEQRFIRLYQRFGELSEATDAMDKRKKFNPIRDLKISANRSYQWARRAGCDANGARDRAIAATKESLEKNREEESILWKLLLRLRKKFPATATSDTTIPAAVMDYINLLYSQYNLTELEKKAIKKTSTRKKKATGTSI